MPCGEKPTRQSSLESKVPKFGDQRPGTREALSEEDAIELRSELTRLLTRDEFPVDRDGLLAILDDKGATPPLVALVRRRLPDGKRYHSTRELLEAVGLAHAEEDRGT